MRGLGTAFGISVILALPVRGFDAGGLSVPTSVDYYLLLILLLSLPAGLVVWAAKPKGAPFGG